MKKLLLVFGTRPEAIKMAPVVMELKSRPECFDVKVCVTAQHRQMLDQVLEFFEITPDYDLNLMKPNQTLYDITCNVIMGMKDVLEQFKPDYAFVHGDTTTSTATAIAAFYAGVKICHVEAGLRTYDKYAPFPEEMNRQLTGRLADIHFSPTKKSFQNLVNENTPKENIYITGNTVIDALIYSAGKVNTITDNDEINMLKSICIEDDIILITGHRRENFGDGFLRICEALKEIALKFPKARIVYPVHLNPNVQKPVYSILNGIDNISLINPLGYPAFVWLMQKSKIIITDSGGVQEEAPSLGKPVLVMREVTERPEAVDAGTVILVGTDKDKIVSETISLMTDSVKYKKMSDCINPYGDGLASKRIVNTIMKLQ
ncbi:MAG: UDP-N-acetylglucosamine 2-epimerase (non-hydrolyzing) [Paludibacteraceae bacterium]|nr:UDP-N-acetylglucosamine 2-epimerase (non-hydrolyzing) [Paludibacteraceae bacterium]